MTEVENYDVECLVDLRHIDGKECVLVQWRGWPNPEDQTWELAESLEAETFGGEIESLRKKKAAEKARESGVSVETPVKRKRGRPAKGKPAVEIAPQEPEVQVAISSNDNEGAVAESLISKKDSLAALAKQGLLSRRTARAKQTAASDPKIDHSGSAEAQNSSVSSSSSSKLEGAPISPSKSIEISRESPPARESTVDPKAASSSSPKSAKPAGPNDNSLDSPLLEATEAAQMPEPESPPANLMLLPRDWKDGSGDAASTKPDAAQPNPTENSATAAQGSPADSDDSEVLNSPASTVASRAISKRKGDTSVATSKKRARRRIPQQDQDFSGDDEDPVTPSRRPSPIRRRPAGQPVRRVDKKDSSPVRVDNKVIPAGSSSMEALWEDIHPGTYINSAVSLLTPDFIRTIMREELERFRIQAQTEKRVVVKHVGGPPPGCLGDSFPRWGLIEECDSGKQLYLPLEEIRCRFSQPLVDFLINTPDAN